MHTFLKIKTTSLALYFVFLSFNYSGQILPEYTVLTHEKKQDGYYFFSAVKPFQKPSTFRPTHFIFDGFGDIIYFKKFPAKWRPGDFKLQPNGMMSYSNLDKYVLLDSLFTIIDSISPKNNFLLIS